MFMPHGLRDTELNPADIGKSDIESEMSRVSECICNGCYRPLSSSKLTLFVSQMQASLSTVP